MTQEWRHFGESGTRTWRGRQSQAMQGLEGHACRVDLYPKGKSEQRSDVLNLCDKDCGESEIFPTFKFTS